VGVTDQFGKANAYLTRNLGYHLDPAGAERFRSLLARVGWKRFEHAVEVVRMQTWPTSTTVADRHKRLMAVMWELAPEKRAGTKYRNPEAEAARSTSQWLDEEVMKRIALDRD
jgi:hypothetical protein